MKKIIISIVLVLLALIIAVTGKKLLLKREYEKLAYESINRAVVIIENYKENMEAYKLDELICELSVYSVSIAKLEEYDEDMDYVSDVARAKSILMANKDQVKGKEFEYLYKGILAIKDDIYSDIGYSYLNEFVNDYIGE